MARTFAGGAVARLLAGAVACTVLAACGGGGGGGSGGGTSYSFQLSGSIAIAETAAVDSDTNDIRQVPYAINDDATRAQALSAPVMLVGSVNRPNTGPNGTNFTSGDMDDVFVVDLVQGQVVELEFASDPASSDLDLFIYDETEAQVGVSDGVDTRFECLAIARSGRYYVNVYAFAGASIYNLRIGAPGTSSSCAQSTTGLGGAADQLIAEPRRGDTAAPARAASLLRAAGARVGDGAVDLLSAGLPAGRGPQRIELPEGAVQRALGLQALSAARRGESLQSASALARRAKVAAAPESKPVALHKVAKQLRASGSFEYVAPNWIAERHATVGTFPPNDRGYSYQRWHYEQISLPSAMSRITALPAQPTLRPIVAVIDDGVVLDHPDLRNQLFSNGRTFVTGADRASGDNLALPADQPVFHGTHVAGTVGAETFDGSGAAGTAPMALILPLRVFPAQGGARSDDIINAMRYAARLTNRSGTLPARRADVINMSLGGDRACDSAYQTAINDVRAAGVIVVVSAGNSGRNDIGQRVAVGSPANCNGALAVSATDARRKVTYYSNTGSALDVAAPGGDSGQSTTGNGAPDNVYSDIATFDGNGSRQAAFGGMMGTSMAAPHVSGVMALMRYVNPNLTVGQVDSLLANGSLTDAVGSAIDYGRGLINARKAVDAALAQASGGATPTVDLVAQPSTIDLGAFQSSFEVEIAAPGESTETVANWEPADAPVSAFAVVEVRVDAITGFPTYVFSVNRNLFAGSGTFYPRLLFTLSSGRTLSVQVSLQKLAGGGTANAANYGPMYVLLIDPATNVIEETVLATLSNGVYNWASTRPYTRKLVSVIAGGDLDNDDLICQRGEPCGAYPVLPPGDDLFAVDLSNGDARVSGSIGNLSFQAAPLSGISPNAVSGAHGSGPWRKSKALPVPGVLHKESR